MIRVMKMRKLFLSMLLSCFLVMNMNVLHAKENTQDAIAATLKSKDVIVMNRDTKEILFAKNIKKRIYPASMTKIMTTIVVIENTKHFDKIVEAVPSDTKVIRDEASIAGLLIGERMRIQDALSCMMLASGSDAAEMLARYTTGNTKDFVDLMNNKAKELHLQDTHFTNVYGKYDKQHYTTVKDMALLMDYAMENPIFQKIVASDQVKIKTNAFEERIAENFVYATFDKAKLDHSYITGAKSGSMDETGLNLASTAEKDGRRVVIVSAEAPIDEKHTNHVVDAAHLYQWYFTNYQKKIIYKKGDTVAIKGNILTPSFHVALPSDIYIEAPQGVFNAYEKTFVSTNQKMIVKPNDVVGILTIKTKNTTTTYEIISDGWHIAISVYVIATLLIILILWLIMKKRRQSKPPILITKSKQKPMKKKP